MYLHLQAIPSSVLFDVLLRLATTVWALATLTHDSIAFFDVSTQDFNLQGLSDTVGAFTKSRNTVWAFAARHPMILYMMQALPSSLLIDAFAEVATHVLHNVSVPRLATTVWAFATLAYDLAAFLDGLAHDFNSQLLADTVCAFAKSGNTVRAFASHQPLISFRRQAHLSSLLIDAFAQVAIHWTMSAMIQSLQTQCGFWRLSHMIQQHSYVSAQDFNSQGLADTVCALDKFWKHSVGLCRTFDAYVHDAGLPNISLLCCACRGGNTELLCAKACKHSVGPCHTYA